MGDQADPDPAPGNEQVGVVISLLCEITDAIGQSHTSQPVVGLELPTQMALVDEPGWQLLALAPLSLGGAINLCFHKKALVNFGNHVSRP